MKAVFALASLVLAVVSPAAAMRSKRDITDLYTRSRIQNVGHLGARAAPEPDVASSSAPSITFSNPKAKDFYVDGKKIPEVDWDLGPSWAGGSSSDAA